MYFNKSYLFFATFLPSTANILRYSFLILKSCFFHPIFLHLLISSVDLSVKIQDFVFNFLNRFLAVLLLFGAIIKLSEIFIIILRPQGFWGIFSIKIIVCLKIGFVKEWVMKSPNRLFTFGENGCLRKQSDQNFWPIDLLRYPKNYLVLARKML